MNRRFLAISALIATIFMLTGLLLLDRPLAQWIHGSDLANATVFVRGLDILDTLAGIHVSYWLASAVFVCSGLVLLALSYATPLPRAFAAVIVLAGLIQAGQEYIWPHAALAGIGERRLVDNLVCRRRIISVGA